MRTGFEGNKIINNILIFLIEMKMKMKKTYSQPSIATVTMENPLMDKTFSGNAGSGTSNTGGGAIGDAKRNNFIFDDEEEEK
jgi:hypothetical protein